MSRRAGWYAFTSPAPACVAALLVCACESISIGTRPQVQNETRASLEPSTRADDATIPIDAELVARRIGPKTYVVTHTSFFDANVLVAVMPDGTLLLASSPYETEGTRALLRWLHTTFKPPRIVAINTHLHFDGTGGNEAYLEDHVEVYASELTTKLLTDRGETMRRETRNLITDQVKRDRVDKMRIAAADHTFPEAKGLSLTFGGEAVEVYFPGAAHSPDNVVVYLRARKVLFGGCMVKAGHAIGYTGDADLAHWESAIRNVQAFAPDARVVIPGHGDVSGADLLENTIRIVRANRDESPKSP